MSIVMTCTACQKRFQVKEEWAGKRAKCPGCATALVIPAATAAASPRAVSPPIPMPEEDPVASDLPIKKKKKRKRADDRPAEPLFFFMIDWTPLRLAVFGGLFLLLSGGVILLFSTTKLGSLFSSDSEVKVVDLYTAINGFRYADIGERVLQSESTALVIPGHRQLVITQENPQGEYLIITVSVPDKETDVLSVGGDRGIYMNRGSLQLKSGDQVEDPRFVVDRRDDYANGYHFSYMPREGSGMLREYLGPAKPVFGAEYKAWSHEGDAKELNSEEGDLTLEFTGQRGMKVKTQTSGKRLDGKQGGTELARMSGLGKNLDKSGLVGAPSGYCLVTWDKGSKGWLVEDQVERPNDIALNWDITCIFRRPKGAAQEATLVVLGKSRPIKLP